MPERGSKNQAYKVVIAFVVWCARFLSQQAVGGFRKTLAVGGRVLNVTSKGQDLNAARDKAYAALEKIDWEEGFYRRDIGWRALDEI